MALFPLLFRYAYSGSLEIRDENVQCLLAGGNMLGLTEVVRACSEYLEAQLHPSNAVGIRAFAALHNCDRLQSEAETFIKIYFTDVMGQEEFLQLDSQSVGASTYLHIRYQ
jgi:hypothetical protein